MSKVRVWSDLHESVQSAIVERYNSGEDVDELASEFGLRSSSLGRKMRHLRGSSSVSMDYYLKYVRKTVTFGSPTRVMVFSDTHFPKEDEAATEAALMIAEKFAPDVVFNLGDTIDATSFSRFDKNNNDPATLLDEASAWRMWFSELVSVVRSKSVDARFHTVIGNHDKRVIRAVKSNPGLANYPSLNFNEILGLRELGVEDACDLIELRQSFGDSSDAMYLHHGSTARKYAGTSARAFSDKMACSSVVVGHAHRTSFSIRRTPRGNVRLYECGCLCDLDVSYDIFPDSSHSVLVGTVSNIGFNLNPVVIEGGRFSLSGMGV